MFPIVFPYENIRIPLENVRSQKKESVPVRTHSSSHPLCILLSLSLSLALSSWKTKKMKSMLHTDIHVEYAQKHFSFQRAARVLRLHRLRKIRKSSEFGVVYNRVSISFQGFNILKQLYSLSSTTRSHSLDWQVKGSWMDLLVSLRNGMMQTEKPGWFHRKFIHFSDEQTRRRKGKLVSLN